MNELQIFHNDTFGEIRTIEEDGKVLFCGSDVAKALGYARPNDAISAHCRATVKRSTPISGKIQEINYLPEGDVYRLIVHSKLPAAEKFERWVFDEVIPSIRRNGGYIAGQDSLSDDELIARALMVAQNKIRDRDNLIAKQEQIIGELAPHANYCKMILDNHGLVSITQIAKDYGMSGNKMNKLLSERGIQYKQSGQWLLYSAHHGKGWTHSKTINITRSDGSPDIVMETKWTQLGRLAIYELLKADGILPIIERESA